MFKFKYNMVMFGIKLEIVSLGLTKIILDTVKLSYWVSNV